MHRLGGGGAGAANLAIALRIAARPRLALCTAPALGTDNCNTRKQRVQQLSFKNVKREYLEQRVNYSSTNGIIHEKEL